MADATPEKKVISKGGCPCHKVRYTIEGPPKSTWVCHCLSCRKASGSLMMANSYIGVDQWRITEGEEHIKSWLDYNTSSGNPFTSYFCGLCGGNLYTSSEELKKEGAYVVQR
ncbi:hypothetical protein OC861_004926 [Tilletia horrida]|nr:hypothetical protein OC861_004926 [Tilletia horrida]